MRVHRRAVISDMLTALLLIKAHTWCLGLVLKKSQVSLCYISILIDNCLKFTGQLNSALHHRRDEISRLHIAGIQKVLKPHVGEY